MLDTYSVLLILRIALVAILYLVIVRVIAVARREIRVAEKSGTVTKDVIGHLVVVDPGTATTVKLGDSLDLRPITTLGRSPMCTIELNSKNVSSENTRITFRDRSLWVEDMNSRNGTLVTLLDERGRYQQPIRVTDEVPVTPKAILQVGDVRFKFAV